MIVLGYVMSVSPPEFAALQAGGMA